MKIAISTITDYNNYGNRLQNYALQEILKEQGHSVETIKNSTRVTKKNKRQILAESIKNGELILKAKNKITKKRKEKEIRPFNAKRSHNFLNFTHKYINETSFAIDENTSSFIEFKDFDCFVIGSDQVWNYEFDRFSKFDFIPYSNENQNVISYAASFGVSDIPPSLDNLYREGLSNVRHISVREEAGSKLVQNLINRNAKVVLDPTMLLQTSDWTKLAESSQIDTSGEYILTYFLGELNREEWSYINNYAREKRVEIKMLGDLNDLENWLAGPSEFVKLFQNAKAIFTDSFHACVFSILFEKYFEVFERKSSHKSMNSRIDTLLNQFEIDDRWHNSNVKEEQIDYSKVNRILDIKRKESLEFLNFSLMNMS